MKKISTIAVACTGLLSFTACSNFLDEGPKSTLTDVAYYKTQSQMESDVNYLYRTGAIGSHVDFDNTYIGSFVFIQKGLTGYFSDSYKGREIVCRYTRRLTRRQNTMQLASKMSEVWDDCYREINMANGAIKHMPEVPVDQVTTDRLTAETKFFRTLNYLYLVRTFGAVPFYTDPYELTGNVELPRTEVSTIYNQIKSDLKDTMGVLPEATFAANGHHITKYVATMMLTGVYIYQHKYAEAAEAMRIVVNSNHKLTTNGDLAMNSAFNRLRSTDDLDEAIYTYEYDNQISPSDWLPTYAFDSDASSNGLLGTYAIAQGMHEPSDRYLNIYGSNNLYRQPNQFYHQTYTNPKTGEVWNSVDNAACCWYCYDGDALLTTGRGTKDWNICRYAEILLDTAESIARSTGVAAEATGYLAQMKARANMEGKTAAEITSSLQSMDEQTFIEECWTERLRGLPLESKMRDMCVRTGIFPNVSETTPGQVTYIPLVGAKNASGAAVKESDLLWSLSVNEIQRNPSLTQNEGYSTK